MNQIGIEYVVLGNHEFDFGATILKDRIKESKFTYFGSNVKEKDTEKLFEGVVDTEVVELPNRFKLGLFGVCTQETPQLSYPGGNVVFDDVYATSKRCVEELEAKQVDVIVALTHLRLVEDQTLSRRVKGIDVQLGGHDHEPYTIYDSDT
jgi:2',3'-cyclic-nucleotide 2'-phosphodiesterase (5'-nucleotidase family)